ncbi:uncharacterized protein [Anoplolepis gracilipes]|uniref:uncharacterized protein n=1 Tax=Anoplolepis gracilipes TaxID=354296 RepID=UPI003B9FAA11
MSDKKANNKWPSRKTDNTENQHSLEKRQLASVIERFNRTEERHVEDVYAGWNLQVDRRVAGTRIRLQRAEALNDQHVTRRFTAAIAEKLLATVYNRVDIAGPAKFKGYTPNWTTEVFKIVKVQRTNPVTYLLEDYCKKSIAGAFYEHELHRANYPDVYLVEKVLRRRGDEVYMKWLG